MEIRDTQKLDTSIDGNLAKDGDSTIIFSRVIGREPSHGSSTGIYSRCRMDFTSNVVRTKGPNFVHLELLDVKESDELNPFGTPATRVSRPTDESHWSDPGHIFGEVTEVGMSGTRSEQNYS